MDWDRLLYKTDEQPLDSFVDGISNMAIFRTVGFIGDSLSSGEFESLDKDGKRHYHDYYEYSWGQYLARKNGFKAYNFSRGGMTAKEYVDSFAENNRFWDPQYACQAYVIALGVNDFFGRKYELGTADDFDLNDWKNHKDTIAGYYGSIIARLKAMQPRAKFFFVTMPRENSRDGNKLKAFAEFLYTLAKKVPDSYVVDLYKYGPDYDDNFKSHFYLYGHLNASGYILTANMIDAYIDYIIRHNPDDFRRVAYIGTDME